MFRMVYAAILGATLLAAQVWPAFADADADAEYIARTSVRSTGFELMRSIALPLMEAELREPTDGQLMTARARKEFLAIFDEQFEYLMLNDMVAATKKAYLKTFSPEELGKVRALFESEAWALLVERSAAHQALVIAESERFMEANVKYLMSRLATRAREQGFEIMETPGLVGTLKRAVGTE